MIQVQDGLAVQRQTGTVVGAEEKTIDTIPLHLDQSLENKAEMVFLLLEGRGDDRGNARRFFRNGEELVHTHAFAFTVTVAKALALRSRVLDSREILSALHPEDIVYRPGLGFLEPVHTLGANIGDRSTDEHLVLSFRSFPGRCPFVERSQGVVVHSHRQHFAFTGLEEPGLAESLELAGRFVQASGRSVDIELNDFLAGYGARIGDGDRGGETVSPGLYHHLRIVEGGVTQAMTERIGHLRTRRLEITVPHPDIFRIAGEVHVLLRMVGRERIIVVREIGRRGNVQEIAREGHGQFAGRVHLAREDIGNGVGALLTRGPGQQDGIHQMFPGCRFDDATHIENHHHPFSPGAVSLAQIDKEFPFGGGKLKVVFHMTVLPLSGLTAEDHDGHIVQRCLELDGGGGKERFLPILVILHRLNGKAVFQSLGFQGIILLEPAVQDEARLFQRLGHGDHIRLGHLAGTGSAGNEILAGNAIQRHPLIPLERQGVTLVAQQDDGFRRCFTRRQGMGLQVGMTGIGVLLETGCLHHILEDPAHVPVHILHGQSSFFDTFHDAFDLEIRARVHQVVPGLDRCDGILLVSPVRDDDAVKAPLVPKDGGQEVVILLGIFSVHLVVGTHHRPGVSFLHRNLEILQVDLPEGPAADQGVILRPVGFLVIRRIVLDGSAGTVALDTAHVSRRHLPGEERILGEIFEISSVQRITMYVHSRSQQHVHAILQHFIAQDGSRPLHQVHIPGTGQERSHRETGRHRMGRIPVRVDPDTGRTVGKNGLRNPQARDGPCSARRSRHQVVRTGSHQQ